MSVIKNRFGKELETILKLSGTTNADANINDNTSDSEYINLNIDKVIPGKYQPRKDFDINSLQELAASIQEHGIIQPLIVRRVGELYEIVAGERRWRAAQMIGLIIIPVIVCKISDISALAFGLIENIQRQDLNPIEEAETLQRLISEFSFTHEQVSKSIGRSRTMVTNLLRILNLSEPVKSLLIQRKLDMGHAKILLNLDAETQLYIAMEIIDKSLSVRVAEQIVKKVKINNSFEYSEKPKKYDAIDSKQLLGKIEEWKRDIPNILRSKVKINIKDNNTGKITFSFNSQDEIDFLLQILNFNVKN